MNDNDLGEKIPLDEHILGLHVGLLAVLEVLAERDAATAAALRGMIATAFKGLAPEQQNSGVGHTLLKMFEAIQIGDGLRDPPE